MCPGEEGGEGRRENGSKLRASVFRRRGPVACRGKPSCPTAPLRGGGFGRAADGEPDRRNYGWRWTRPGVAQHRPVRIEQPGHSASRMQSGRGCSRGQLRGMLPSASGCSGTLRPRSPGAVLETTRQLAKRNFGASTTNPGDGMRKVRKSRITRMDGCRFLKSYQLRALRHS